MGIGIIILLGVVTLLGANWLSDRRVSPDVSRRVAGALDAHEVDREIAPVDFRKTHGVLLRGDDDLGLTLLAPIDEVDNFLLGEPMVIGEAPIVHQLISEFDQAAFETLGLGDAAERGHFLVPHEIQLDALPGKEFLEVKRTVDAFDDSGGGIVLGDPLPQFRRVPVALGDEDRARPGKMRRRLAERSSRQHVTVAPRLFAINQHNVAPPAAQSPVLEGVIKQKRVASKSLDRVAPALHPILIHQDDDILEI